MRYRRVLLLALIAGIASGTRGQALEHTPPDRFARWMVGDAVGLIGSVEAGALAAGLGLGGGIALATLGDVELGEDFREGYTGAAVPILDTANRLGDPSTLGVAAALWAATLATRDARLQDAAFTSFEAGFYASSITWGLKMTVGRLRPSDTAAPYAFQPFSGHDSFPSGHTTLAFALAVPWAVYYPGPVSYGLVGVAAGTGIARIARAHHWPSDVLAGALIGSATGYALARRHLAPSRAPSGAAGAQIALVPFALPRGGGLTLALDF